MDLIPDHLIALWHPAIKGEDEKKVGKQSHLEELIKKANIPGIEMKQIVLFDDDKNNIKVGAKKGVKTWFCDGSNAKKDGEVSGFHRGIWTEFVKAKGIPSSGGGGCALM